MQNICFTNGFYFFQNICVLYVCIYFLPERLSFVIIFNYIFSK